jgi:hypothetical protein
MQLAAKAFSARVPATAPAAHTPRRSLRPRRIGEAFGADHRHAPGQHRQHHIGVVLARREIRTQQSRAGRRPPPSPPRAARVQRSPGPRSRCRGRGRSPASRSARRPRLRAGRARCSPAGRRRSRGCPAARPRAGAPGVACGPGSGGPARWRTRCSETCRPAHRDHRRSRHRQLGGQRTLQGLVLGTRAVAAEDLLQVHVGVVAGRLRGQLGSPRVTPGRRRARSPGDRGSARAANRHRGDRNALRPRAPLLLDRRQRALDQLPVRPGPVRPVAEDLAELRARRAGRANRPRTWRLMCLSITPARACAST